MGPRLLFQIILLLAPFALYAFYRFAIERAETEGRRPWPIRALFSAGVALSLAGYLYLVIRDADREVEECFRPAQFVDGVLVPGEKYPCEKDLSITGRPADTDPGSVAEGVGDPVPPGPADRNETRPN